MKNRVTAQMRRFCEEYLKDLNGQAAAIRAGYKPTNATHRASILLARDDVKEIVEGLQGQRSQRTGIDLDYVLSQAVKLHERCMQEIEPELNAKGEQIIDGEGRAVFRFNAAGAAKSLELVGKHVNIQAFKDRVETDLTVKDVPALLVETYGGG